MTLKAPPTPRTTLPTWLSSLMLRPLLHLLIQGQLAGRALRDRGAALSLALSVYAMTALGAAFAQTFDGTGNQNPDAILNGAVCGAGGWLSWFTSTKFLVVLLVFGLVGYFLGRAIGKRDNDGIVGTLIAVAGLGAIRILVKVVTTC